MFARTRGLLVGAALGAWALACPTLASGQAPLTALPPLAPAMPAGAPALLPPPPPPPQQPDFWAPVDPGKDGWGPYGPPSVEPAWFTTIELQLVRPFLKDRIVSEVPLSDGAQFLVPSANLGWTASPTFELGYRLPNSLGYFTINYRFLNSSGDGSQSGPDGVDSIRTRLSLNQTDIDYGTSRFEFLPEWFMSWRIGMRVENVYFDSTLKGSTVFQQSSNNFFGLGPHSRLNLERSVSAVPGLGVFTRMDGVLGIGRISQRFRDPSTGTGNSYEQNGTQAVPTLTLQAGLTYAPPWMHSLRLSAGYFYEYFWYLGQLGENSVGTFSATRAELGDQGLFVRARFDF